MNRAIVIGCPGSGKSEFTRALHEATGLPAVHLDLMYWNADRTTVPRPVFLLRLQKALEQARWIIDGNYASTMELRLQHCDTVFFLDYPTQVCLEGIAARQGRPRPDLPWVEQPGEEDPEFLDMVRNFQTAGRPQILELLGRYPEKHIVTFQDREEAARWLTDLRKK